ncbi:maleylpyruvate isomerase family mycothiol-dependent enzyme [Nocardia sp. NBC_01730]|uniref:maleylpyruvate isomerase family mycothiol-dependent enzyme n=1 Tax=Nocardia sp. NBC_01730 TaxID=2975998 RepID=UPI002E116D6B|nr:maleylpyruvate isomerase family mycothiol-dependent enzyme [Nocardia sp. NBC_01730]
MEFDELALDEQLQIARRGTAYFAQRLARFSDADLGGNTLLPGWTRRHLLAHIGYNAAALCRLLDWAATGIETPMYASAEQRAREIDEGSTLSPAALRNLFTHTAARLDEKWRNLPPTAWAAEVRTAQGRVVPAAETTWMRTREVWIHAVDLASDGRFGDFPSPVLGSLLTDIVGMWRKKGLGIGLVLAVEAATPIAVHEDSTHTARVAGPLAAVARWAAGRGGAGVRIEGHLDGPPGWL